MAESRTRQFGKIAKDVDTSGNITEDALSPSISLGVTTYDSSGQLPIRGLSNGDQAWVGNRLFISNGSGWYNAGLVNLNPSITSGPEGAEYVLDSAGNPVGGSSIDITLTAVDSDGTPIIWSYTASDSAFDLATIDNDSNGNFTFTSKSLADILAAGYDSDGGSFSVTFKASDGISFDTDSASFTLSYFVAAGASVPDADWTGSITQANFKASAGAASTSSITVSGTGDFVQPVIWGDTLAVASTPDNDGRVHVYVTADNGATWIRQQEIDPPVDNQAGNFGRYMALREDALFVCEPYASSNGVSNGGKLHVYTRTNTTWTLQGTIQAPSAVSSSAYFAYNCAIEPINGELLLINHMGADGAHVYKSVDDWQTWTKVASIDPTSLNIPGTDANFQMADGYHNVAIYENTLVISGIKTGSYYHSALAVYVTSNGGTTWTNQAILKSPRTDTTTASLRDRLGYSTDLWGDIIVSGAYVEPHGSFEAGQVYAYTRTGTTWSSAIAINEPAGNRTSQGRFGSMLQLSGKNLIVGKYNDDRVYIFRTDDNGSTWTLDHTFTDDNVYHGVYVALWGNYAGISDFSNSGSSKFYLHKVSL